MKVVRVNHFIDENHEAHKHLGGNLSSCDTMLE